MTKDIATKLQNTVAPLTDEQLEQAAGGIIGGFPAGDPQPKDPSGGTRTNSCSGGREDDCLD